MSAKRKQLAVDAQAKAALDDLLDRMTMAAPVYGSHDDEQHLARLEKLEASIQRLRDRVAAKNIYSVALAAMDVHYWYDQIAHDRWNEASLAAKGDHSVQGAATSRKKRSEKAQNRYAEIRKAVRKRLKDHPKDSVDYARHRVAEEHCDANGRPLRGWSYSSIRRATLHMKQPKRK